MPDCADETLELWERDLASRGYRKFIGSGRGYLASALYQREVTRTGGDGIFFNFDYYTYPASIADRGDQLEGWMQITRADGRTVNIQQFAFKPDEIISKLDAIEAEWQAIVDAQPNAEDGE